MKIKKKLTQLFCKHNIIITGGGYDNNGYFTTWVCKKCNLYMREDGIKRHLPSGTS